MKELNQKIKYLRFILLNIYLRLGSVKRTRYHTLKSVLSILDSQSYLINRKVIKEAHLTTQTKTNTITGVEYRKYLV